MHCAWDDSNGMRHGQKLQHIKLAMEAADAAPAAPKPKAAKAKPKAKAKAGKRR